MVVAETSGSSSHIVELLFILVVAWVLGRIFGKRLDLPPMLGELVAGLIFGPPILNMIQPSEYIDFLSELGIFFLMFYAGTETDPKKFFESLRPSIICGLGGFIIPFTLGYYGTLYFFPGADQYEALFVALGMSITAIAVNARILMDLDMHRHQLSNVLIGAALVDDILSLGIFSALVDTVKNDHFSYLTVVMSVVHVVLFFLITYTIGKLILPYLNKYYLEEGHGFVFALMTALVFAYIAEALGLHLVIGAFLAGLFVREEMKDGVLIDKLNDRLMIISYGFLGPVFFVSLAFHVNLQAIVDEAFFLGIVLAIAIGGKFIGSYLGCRLAKVPKEDSTIISAGMNGRGAVELILVSVGVQLGILEGQLVSILVSMAFITTFITPFAFKILLNYYRKRGLYQ